jgi:ADP-heptose:LPS heptosyltransferase
MSTPSHIVLIKAHSMGIGDLLRSSAAWRVLQDRWPQAQLHLLMLSKHTGYPSEAFIRAHHLLASANFVTVKTGDPGQAQRSLPFASIARDIDEKLGSLPIDMVIDCEPYGIKTSLLARKLAKQHRALSVGIAQFPLRRFFYDKASPSVPQYMAKHGLSEPMDYTERDFVALAALGLQRKDVRIELQVGPEGAAWQALHAAEFDHAQEHVVLNIGCGTVDALPKRPPMQALVSAMVTWYQRSPFALHLTGAGFEKEVNDEFMQLYLQALSSLSTTASVTNWAGQCSLNELAGLIALADVLVSSDSGPYHMGVALNVPTLCWFNFDTPASYHRYHDVVVQTMPSSSEFADAAMHLLGHS